MRPITHCLNPTLTAICKQSLELESLSAIIHHYLPESYRSCCTVGSFNKGCLTLVVSDPAWASELRFHLPQLRDHLRQQAKLHQLITIKIQLSRQHAEIPKQTLKTTDDALSMHVRQLIQHVSEQCTYLPLKDALMKLGRD
jgi:hypothetical protein